MQPPSTIERAFMLARAGECRSMAELRRRLKLESCVAVDAHLSGPTIARQLKAAMPRDGG